MAAAARLDRHQIGLLVGVASSGRLRSRRPIQRLRGQDKAEVKGAVEWRGGRHDRAEVAVVCEIGSECVAAAGVGGEIDRGWGWSRVCVAGWGCLGFVRSVLEAGWRRVWRDLAAGWRRV
jgi:hypothetical protein